MTVALVNHKSKRGDCGAPLLEKELVQLPSGVKLEAVNLSHEGEALELLSFFPLELDSGLAGVVLERFEGSGG